ncbi:McrC family protein [Roseimarinus sediminis]|uniref:McrC family protein n=1 Tax=Roseimarinus sediminis TaxID=1610899 RepID=UPI003D1F0103
MTNDPNHITVFEHETIRFDYGEKKITEEQFKELSRYHGVKGTPFFSLCYNGVKFNQHVGVIQLGKTVIEVLPKADKLDKTEKIESKWRDILIGILKAVGAFEVKSTSSSNLRIRPNSVLDLYFELFVGEVEYLLRRGLVKQYRSNFSNCTALKGSLQFSQHISRNLVHKEHFFIKHTVYDVQHRFNQVIYKTLKLIRQINTSSRLKSRIGALLLFFPEMNDLRVSEQFFQQVTYNHKTEVYKTSMEIARLILLQYHPDLSSGRNHVLALMFDMNLLWERFVLVSLRKNPAFKVEGQRSKQFWKPENGYRTTIRPDIVLSNERNRVVLDTKWKNLDNFKPNPEDLRQMYVYHDYFNADKVALVYPSENNQVEEGHYFTKESQKLSNKHCAVLTLSINPNIHEWQKQINKEIDHWIKND